MAYVYFDNFMRTLERMGVADILLPFLLVFTLVFATLEKTKILGVKYDKQGAETHKPKSNLNTIISAVIGLAVVIPHATRSYPPGRDVVEILNNALPGVAMLVVAIFSLLLLLGLFSGKTPNFMKEKTIGGGITFVMLIAVAIIFIDSANIYRLPRWLYFLQDPNIQAGVVVIAVFGLLVWFITRDEDNEDKSTKESFMQKLGKIYE